MLTSNNRKKYIIALTVLILILLSNISLAVVNQTDDFYVNDYANLLDETTKQYIINCNKDLYSKIGAQVVVVTVPNLEGNSLEEYATELFRRFGIGSKEKDNGVLLLLALEERQFRVEVGYGLEGALPDGKTGRIQDEYIIPYLKNDNWNDGIKNGFNAILQVISEEYGVQIDASESPIVVEKNDSSTFANIIYIVIIVLIIILTKVRILLWGGFFGGGGSSRRRFLWWRRRLLRRRRFITVEAVASQEAEVHHGGGGSSRGF